MHKLGRGCMAANPSHPKTLRMAADLDHVGEVGPGVPEGFLSGCSLRRARQGEQHGKPLRVAGAGDDFAAEPCQRLARRLAPALELGRVEITSRMAASARGFAITKTGVPAGWSGRSMKGKRAMIFGPSGAHEAAPPRARRNALVEPKDAEIAARARHGFNHRDGARVRANRAP